MKKLQLTTLILALAAFSSARADFLRYSAGYEITPDLVLQIGPGSAYPGGWNYSELLEDVVGSITFNPVTLVPTTRRFYYTLEAPVIAFWTIGEEYSFDLTGYQPYRTIMTDNFFNFTGIGVAHGPGIEGLSASFTLRDASQREWGNGSESYYVIRIGGYSTPDGGDTFLLMSLATCALGIGYCKRPSLRQI